MSLSRHRLFLCFSVHMLPPIPIKMNSLIALISTCVWLYDLSSLSLVSKPLQTWWLTLCFLVLEAERERLVGSAHFFHARPNYVLLSPHERTALRSGVGPNCSVRPGEAQYRTAILAAGALGGGGFPLGRGGWQGCGVALPLSNS